MAATLPDHRQAAGTLEQWSTPAPSFSSPALPWPPGPPVPFAKARLAIDEGSLGLLLLCLSLGSIVAMPITGVLATLFGCRAVLLVSGVIVAVTLPMLAIADTPLTLAITVAIFGASVGTLDVTMNIQAVIVEKDSGRSLMSGFHGLLAWVALSALVASAPCSPSASPHSSPPSASAFLPYGNAEAGYAPPFVLPRGFIILIGALCFLVFLGEGAVLDWSAVFLTSLRGIDPAQAGLGYAMVAIAMTCGRLMGDRILGILGGQRILIFGGIFASAGFAPSWYSHSFHGSPSSSASAPPISFRCCSQSPADRRTCRQAWPSPRSPRSDISAFWPARR